ncbi:MAG TPA: hypothetical protein VGH62_13705 [Bradyrhizobium sp.]|jgi:hypothetical protein
MTTGTRLTEFGKRHPTPLPPAPGPKRSNHVALLVMGTLAVGSGAYGLMPSAGCQPTPPGPAAPGMPQANAGCASRGGSGGSGGSSGSSRYGFYGDSSKGGASSSSSEPSGGVTRGGFGSFARAFGFGGG